MEDKWTDRDELDRINEVFEEQFKCLHSRILNFNEIAPGCNMGNIGLYSGNKMRSMYRRYKEHNVDYANSQVNRAIETYFVFQFDNALYCFKRFAEKAQRIITNRSSEKTIRDYILNSPDLEEYKRICDEVYEFDLDRDAADAINYVLDNLPIIIGLDINFLIEEYNNELKQLGVEKLVEKRDLDMESMEMPEEVVNMLRFVFEEIANQLENGDFKTPQESTQEVDINKSKIKKNKE